MWQTTSSDFRKSDGSNGTLDSLSGCQQNRRSSDIDLLGEDLGGAGLAGLFPTLEIRRQSRGYVRERSLLQTAITAWKRSRRICIRPPSIFEIAPDFFSYWRCEGHLWILSKQLAEQMHEHADR